MSRMDFEWRPLGDRYLCPVCGLPDYFDVHAFDNRGGCIAEGICPCCFFEPGFDDDPNASANAQPTVRESIRWCRQQWISHGMPWRRGTVEERIALGVYDPARTSDNQPEDWCPQRQLERLLSLAPDLR